MQVSMLQNSLLFWDVTVLRRMCWQLFSDYSGQVNGIETSVTHCHPTQHDIADERRPQRNLGGKLKTHSDGICERTSV